MTGIYCILNTINSHRYIGQSRDLARRKSYHFTALLSNSHKNSHLQAAFNLYGPLAFRWLILHTTPFPHTLDHLERHYIALYASNLPTHGYNYEPGGRTNPTLTLATRRNMSIAQNKRRNREFAVSPSSALDHPDKPFQSLPPASR